MKRASNATSNADTSVKVVAIYRRTAQQATHHTTLRGTVYEQYVYIIKFDRTIESEEIESNDMNINNNDDVKHEIRMYL